MGLEKVRLSGREHLAGVQWEIKTHCVRQVKTERYSLVGMLSRHPTGGRACLFDGLASLTKEEKVRLSSREALAASDMRLILVSRVVEPRRWWTES